MRRNWKVVVGGRSFAREGDGEVDEKEVDVVELKERGRRAAPRSMSV